jgi:hypothetical protein
MKTGIMAIAIAVVLLMATMQTVAGANCMSYGKIYFENGTRADRTDGWYVEVWNLDQEYGSEPWNTSTAWNPGEYDWGLNCQYESPSDHMKVRITSPEGWTTAYTGENISVYSDVEYQAAKIAQDVTVYEVIPETENFTKSMPAGWNLISPPLAPLDNSVSAVLNSISGNYDAVKSYNAATHQFEDATAMDPGTGYFVHVTTAGTWRYEGTAYDSINVSLSQGLNMVGWTNETGSALPGALSSIDGSYRYVAHWDASSQSYEVYLPGAPVVFNDFTTMDRGGGYFIAATSSCTLVYP